MMNFILPVLGTKKALWGVTSFSFVLLVITPELIVAAGALLAIIFTGIVNIMNARSAARQRVEQSEKMDRSLAKQEEIAVKVDGAAHGASEQIKLLQQQVTMLLADQAAKKEIATALATAAAKTPTVP